jgi:two-component system cell cycle response regulator
VYGLEECELYRATLDALEQGVYVVDRDRKILVWNRMAEQITGYSAAEVVGHHCQDHLLEHCREDGRVQCVAACPLEETLADGQPRKASLFLRHKRGYRVPVQLTTSVVRNQQGQITGGVEAFYDQAPAADALVKLRAGDTQRQGTERGREYLEACLDRELDLYASEGESFGILLLHVDQWHQLRVTHGKEAAEAMIGILSETLVYTLHPADVFGRWSDDEFLVIARDSSVRALELDAELLRSMAGNAQFRWWGDRVPLTLSVGGAIVAGGDTRATMLSRAQHGLEVSMERGGDMVTVLDTAGQSEVTCLPS